jgi:uncharacterized protein YjbI with pentapeptide repeats
VWSSLVSGRGGAGLGLEWVDRRLDLRGIGFVTGRVAYSGHLANVDLSYARLEHSRWISAHLSGCRFDGADVSDTRLWSSTVSDCQFSGCDLRSSALGTWAEERSNAWAGVSFVRCDLRGALFSGASLTSCEFVDCRMDGVEFHQCRFDGVRFAGKVAKTRFDGRVLRGRQPAPSMTRVDFSEAELDETDFFGCEMTDVVGLDRDGLMTIPHELAVIARAIPLLDPEHPNTRVLTAVWNNALRAGGSLDATGVFNRADYLRMRDGEALTALAESTLARAIALG